MAKRGGMKGTTTGSTVAVEGYQELMRCLKKMDKTARKEFRAKLRDVAKIVVREAQSQAESRGLHKSGELVRKIKPSITARSIAIRAAASKKSRKYPGGFNYPRRYEFEKGGARAFLRPALEAKQEEVVKKFDEIFVELSKDWGSDG